MEKINLKLRSEILEYSLLLENAINDLLLINLGILDGGKDTRLFGNKAGVSFKNKIDLLFDINVFSKTENLELELLMIFRNKFLHDIKCNSFSDVLEQLDNGIKNRFKKYFKENADLSDESSCKTACDALFLKNISIIKNKTIKHRLKMEDKNEIFQIQNNEICRHLDITCSLVNDLCLIIEDSELEVKEVGLLGEKLRKKLESVGRELNSNEEYHIKMKKFCESTERLNDFYGIVKNASESMLDLSQPK